MDRLGRWMIVAGLGLAALDMLLITLGPHKPLPRGVGLLFPVGIGLGFASGFIRRGGGDG